MSHANVMLFIRRRPTFKPPLQQSGFPLIIHPTATYVIPRHPCLTPLVKLLEVVLSSLTIVLFSKFTDVEKAT